MRIRINIILLLNEIFQMKLRILNYAFDKQQDINIKATFPQNCNAGRVQDGWKGVSRLQSDAMQRMRKILRARLLSRYNAKAGFTRATFLSENINTRRRSVALIRANEKRQHRFLLSSSTLSSSPSYYAQYRSYIRRGS